MTGIASTTTADGSAVTSSSSTLGSTSIISARGVSTVGVNAVGSTDTRIDVVNSDARSSTVVSFSNIPGLYVDDDVDVVRPVADADTVDVSASVVAADACVIVKGIKFWCFVHGDTFSGASNISSQLKLQSIQMTMTIDDVLKLVFCNKHKSRMILLMVYGLVWLGLALICRKTLDGDTFSGAWLCAHLQSNCDQIQ